MFSKDVADKYKVVGDDDKWRPSAEDLWDYANNVEHLYKRIKFLNSESKCEKFADEVIDEYNASQNSHARKFQGDANEVAEYFWKQAQEDE